MKLFAFFIAVVSYAKTVQGNSFEIADCIRLDVDGEVMIDAIKDGQQEFSYKLDLSADTPFTVSGACSQGGTSNSITVHFNQSEQSLDWTVLFTTTKEGRALMDQMIKFTPSSLFKNSTLPSDLVLLSDVGSTLLSLTNASFVCKAPQSIPFESASKGSYNFTVRQDISNLQVQAFDLKNQTFSPAEECSADQTTLVTEPTSVHTENTGSTVPPTTIPTPEENTYVVYNQFNNETCIVLRGDIAFANIVYNLTNGEQATAYPIAIPTMNQTAGSVEVTGSCSMGDGTQQLIITFYQDWTLNLTFAWRSHRAAALLAPKAADEYSLRDIQLEYVLTPEFFPNASDPNSRHTAQIQDLPDFMMGKTNGSYKCNSKISKTLDNGVELQTSNLQYKAFSMDNSTSFGDKVSECPADNGSSHIVPIAVGLAISIVIIVLLVAYLLGHRQGRKGGYQTL